MTVDEFWEELFSRRGLRATGPARDGNMSCIDPNQTIFEIPDPREMPDGSVRRDMLELILAHLEEFCVPY